MGEHELDGATKGLKRNCFPISPLLGAIAGLALVACASGAPARRAASVPPPSTDPATVVVLSFDGFAADYLAHEHLPNFAKLIARGVRADGLVPPFPSKTFPSHYSMATGLYPGHHGIVASSFYDPARHEWFTKESAADGSWFGGEPIWVTAGHHGIRTATYYWPGSEAEIAGARPTYYRVFDVKTPDSTKVDQIAAWLRLPREQRPGLIMAYFPEVDIAGHDYGPASPEVHDALITADRSLGRMLDSLDVRAHDLPTELLVVSDHGMASVTPDRAIYVDDLVRLDSLSFKGERATASIWSEGHQTRLDSVYETLRRTLTNARAYRLAELPARWHTNANPRFGDLLLVADPGYALAVHHPPTPIKPGEHGYDNADPVMRGIFIAAGARFPAGRRIPALDNVVIHPLIAELLGIPPAASLDAPAGELARIPVLPFENR
jgi:predicted AlkP superfamily pyrophosphatase or phosphodiesterase